jgi:hypothetical protein
MVLDNFGQARQVWHVKEMDDMSFSLVYVTFLVGLALIVIAVLGSGIEAKFPWLGIQEIKIPSLGRLPRVVSFTIGTVFLALCVFWPGIFPDVARSPGLAPSAPETAAAEKAPAKKAAEEGEAKAALDKILRSIGLLP